MDTATDTLLHPDDRRELASWLRSNSHPSDPISRTRILLDLDDGVMPDEVARRQRVGRATVFRWLEGTPEFDSSRQDLSDFQSFVYMECGSQRLIRPNACVGTFQQNRAIYGLA